MSIEFQDQILWIDEQIAKRKKQKLMNPIKFDQANVEMTKPKCMTDEECGSLPVCQATTPSGHQVFISCWEPTEEELKQLLETKKLWLWQFGNHVQPVAIGTEHPFQ